MKIIFNNFQGNSRCGIYGNVFKNFAVKFIPLKRLKFKDLGYSDKMCEIYKTSDRNEFHTAQRSLQLISIACFGIFLLPIEGVYKLVTNILIQPYLYRKYNMLLRNASMRVVTIYLLRNGSQILLFTKDSAIHLLNILDINKVEENGDTLTIECFDKIFLIDLTNAELNEDVLDAIRSGRLIDTVNNYSNYNRFTFTK
jgi:hypothetical protein